MSRDYSELDRVRLACSFGAIVGGLVLGGNAFADVPSDVLGGLFRDAVRDLRPGVR